MLFGKFPKQFTGILQFFLHLFVLALRRCRHFRLWHLYAASQESKTRNEKRNCGWTQGVSWSLAVCDVAKLKQNCN